jgi:hypothetical protein
MKITEQISIVIMWVWIQEVHCSILDGDSVCPLRELSRRDSGKYLKTGHDILLPNPKLLVIYGSLQISSVVQAMQLK